MLFTTRRLVEITLVAAFIGLSACYAVAQQTSPSPSPVDVAIESATANQATHQDKRLKGWMVFVTFTKQFDPTKDKSRVTNPSNYKIINANTGSSVPVSSADFIQFAGSDVFAEIKLLVPSDDALNTDNLFYLFTPNLLFGGVPSSSVPMHEIKVKVEKTAEGKTIPIRQPDNAEYKPAWGLKASKGKDDSDLYGSYELTKGRGIATTGTGDFKVAIPFFSNFWSRTSKFSLGADFKASSDANADPDSLKFAVEWFLPVTVGKHPESGFAYRAVDLINSGKIEAPKNFNNINALWENRWLFPSSHFQWNSKKFRMFLDPFVGSELGKNLKSPLKAAEGKGIARLMVGANLTLQIPVNNLVALKGFEFTSSFIRRWPLISEILVDKDASGNLVALTLSKGPKDYSDSKFIIKVNDYFGPYIGYEWGRLPPNYELVDHKWTFGLLFKSKIKAQ